jgi:ribosome-associated toxin RatA of RatAB toxin-antitoxin module
MSGKVVKEKEMGVSTDALWKVITDFESYPDFVDEVVLAKKVSGGKGQIVQFELEVVKRFQYTLEFHTVEKKELSWKLVESNFFKKNDGRWLLKDLGGNRTHATYEVDVGFGFMVPGWVTRKLTEVNLPKMLEAFESRAREVQS